MKRAASFLLIVAVFLLTGCLTQTQYVCPNGSVVAQPESCALPRAGATDQPVAPSVIAQPTLSPSQIPAIQPPSTQEVGELEKAILLEINRVRLENGLDELAWSERAASAARKYAQTLFQEKRFAHTGSDGSNIHDRLRAEGLLEFVANENLAQLSFNGTLPSAQKVVEGWMKSPGHRSNIIDVDRLYDHAGIGAFCDADACVFAYTAVGLVRHGAYTLNQNFYSFVYLNDPGYGFSQTVRMNVTLQGATGFVDAYVLPDSHAFEAAKDLPAEQFQNRAFAYVQKYENTRGFSDFLNASVGFGLMIVNTEDQPVSFNLSIGLAE